MNLRASILGLILISALTLFSCEEDINTIGLPPENNLGIFFADIPFGSHVSQIWYPDYQFADGIIYVGSYLDPQLGTIGAQAFSDVSLQEGRDSSLTEPLELDSIVLKLRITNYIGELGAPTEFKYEAYRTSTEISDYDGASDINFQNDIKIGESTFMFYPDSVNLPLSTESDTSLHDTNGIYIYTTSMKLGESFANEFFNKFVSNNPDTSTETDSVFNNQVRFDDFFPGISLNAVDAPAILSFNINDLNSELVMHYHENDTAKTHNFFLNGNNAFNNFIPNEEVPWSGSEFDEVAGPYVPFESENAFFQSGTNLYLRLNMSDFTTFGDTTLNAVIQGAQIQLFADSTLEGYSPHNQIIAYATSSSILNDAALNLTDNDLVDLIGTVALDTTDYSYSLNFPTYLQGIADMEQDFDQVIVKGSVNNSLTRSTIDKSKIRLKLYYTLPDKNN